MFVIIIPVVSAAAVVALVWWMRRPVIDFGSVSDAWRAEQRAKKDPEP